MMDVPGVGEDYCRMSEIWRTPMKDKQVLKVNLKWKDIQYDDLQLISIAYDEMY